MQFHKFPGHPIPSLIIGLVGLDGSGKTTLAKDLEHDLRQSGRYIRLGSIKAPMSQWVSDVTGHSLVDLYRPEVKSLPTHTQGQTIRHLFTDFGKVIEKHAGPGWLGEQAVKSIQNRTGSHAYQVRAPGKVPFHAVIYDDVRLPEQAAALKRWGGYIVSITEPYGSKDSVESVLKDEVRETQRLFTDYELPWRSVPHSKPYLDLYSTIHQAFDPYVHGDLV